MKYYIDTCIWLNFFNKEEHEGKQFWKIAEEFFQKEGEFFFSDVVLSEIRDDFQIRKKFLEEVAVRIYLVEEDYVYAKTLQKNNNLGLFDCLHIAVCIRTGCVLITRDKKLGSCAKQYISVALPEDSL